MNAASLTIRFWILGFLIGANAGAYVPNYHYPAFLREVVIFSSFFQAVWEYELWGNILGIILTLVILSRFGAGLALRFGFGYALAFAIVIFARAPYYHSPWPTLLGPISAVLAAVLVSKLFATSAVYILRKCSFDRKKWASWVLPTKSSLIFGALGTLGLFISVLGWFGIQAYNIIPGLEIPRSDVLRFPYAGNVIELYGTDGSSIARPIQILGARKSGGGVPSEYFWINTYYPRHQRTFQAVTKIPSQTRVTPTTTVHVDGTRESGSYTTVIHSRCFDMLELQNWLGRKTTLFFEITDFYECDADDPPKQATTISSKRNSSGREVK